MPPSKFIKVCTKKEVYIFSSQVKFLSSLPNSQEYISFHLITSYFCLISEGGGIKEFIHLWHRKVRRYSFEWTLTQIWGLDGECPVSSNWSISSSNSFFLENSSVDVIVTVDLYVLSLISSIDPWTAFPSLCLKTYVF